MDLESIFKIYQLLTYIISDFIDKAAAVNDWNHLQAADLHDHLFTVH